MKFFENKFVSRKNKILFLISIVFFLQSLITESLTAGSLDGTSSVQFQQFNNVFYDQEYARGFVRMDNGFTVTVATGAGRTHGSSVFMDTCLSVSGAIDLRETNTIFLQSDLILDNGVTFSSGGNIYGYDRSIILNGDLKIPDGKIIHIGGRLAINGNGHKLILGNSSQLFVDIDATLTLKKLVFQNTRNQPGHPAIQCASTGSKICLDDIVVALADDFYFNRGQMFIHSDVCITGTSAFVYRSCQQSFITSGAKLFFDVGTTFSVAPATFTNCLYSTIPTTTTNNFILMADQTSSLYLNGSNLSTTFTGCRFCGGRLFFDNRVALKSSASNILLSINQTPIQILTSGADVFWSPDMRFVMTRSAAASQVAVYPFTGSSFGSAILGPDIGTGLTPFGWSPDGKFLLYGTDLGYIYVYPFTGAALGSSITGVIGSVTSRGGIWSPDGKFIAISDYNGMDHLNLISFLGNGLGRVITADLTADASPWYVSWSPDGKFIAVGSGGATPALYVFPFTGSELGIPITKFMTTNCSRLAWSPDGRFIAFTTGSALKVISFTGSGFGPTISTSSGTQGAWPVVWSPDGRYIAIANGLSTDYKIQIFPFTGNSFGTPVQVIAEDYPRTLSWSPDGKFLAVSNANVGKISVYILNYGVDRSPQALSNSIVFGNAALGSSYDLNVRVLSESGVSLDGIINDDNVN